MKASKKFMRCADMLAPCTERRISVTIRMEPEVLRKFKERGDGWQTHINAVLRAYILAYVQDKSKT